jgi:uncharacterized delta-60 repeat protein
MSNNQVPFGNKAARAVGQVDPAFNVAGTIKTGGSGVFPELKSGGSQKFYIVEYDTHLLDLKPSYISRYNADGTRDGGFNGGETLEIPSLIPKVPGVDAYVARIYIQGIAFNTDETITCVGVAGALDPAVVDYYYAPGAIRITATGQMDASFGNRKSPEANNGTAIYYTNHSVMSPDQISYPFHDPVRWQSQLGKDILFLSRILADGYSHGLYHLVKMKPDGHLDEGFGANGLLLIEDGRDAVLGPYGVDGKGRITMAGNTNSDQGVVLRYTDAGEPDSEFGEGGRLLVEAPGAALISIENLNVAADGKPTLLVTYAKSGVTQLALMRRLENGAADPDFNSGNPLVVDPAAANGRYTLHVDSVGRYIIASENNTRITRVTAAGALDSEFGGSGSIEYPDFTYLKVEAVQGVDLLVTVRSQGPSAALSLVRISGSDSR